MHFKICCHSVFNSIYLSFFAQTLTVQYDYKMHEYKDSTNIISAYTYLKIKENTSLFFSDAAYKSESIMTQNDLDGKKIDFKNLPLDPLGYIIEKKLDDKVLVYYSSEFINHDFQYSELPAFKWQITTFSKTILDQKVILAKTNYGGRTYEAYFAPGIPVQDGPYKFAGLPGLILEMYDSKMDQHFLAVGLSTSSTIEAKQIIEKGKFIPVPKIQYLKMKKDFEKAPRRESISLMKDEGVKEKMNKNRDLVNVQEIARDMEQKMILFLEKENKIEIN